MLLQVAATMPHTGPSWEALAVSAFGVLWAVTLLWIRAINLDRAQIRREQFSIETEMKVLRTILLGSGTGLQAQLERIGDEVSALRKDFHTALEEMAEQRGRNSIVKP